MLWHRPIRDCQNWLTAFIFVFMRITAFRYGAAVVKNEQYVSIIVRPKRKKRYALIGIGRLYAMLISLTVDVGYFS